jgi:uracil-DNA glycosylase
MQQPIDRLLREIRACTNCAGFLPCEPRPIIQFSASSSLLIIGQAPGRRAHDSGIPFSDASGERLRQWLGLDDDTFYDAKRIAIMPMGFCYPGTVEKGGDILPPAICADLWHDKIRAVLPAVKTMALVGGLAQRAYLPQMAPSMTEAVADWQRTFPAIIPLPHPSWRNTGWIKRHPWFEETMLPAVRRHIQTLLQT